MTWKRHFQIVPTKKLQGGAAQPSHDGVAASAGKYASWLPEVYSGQPNRVDRYDQYNEMDADTEISTALDVIADFCTQTEEIKDLPFHLDYHEDVTEIEVNLLETALRQWCKLNSFKRNVWRTVRNVLKYGDQFYLRDPETFEWLWIDQSMVKTIVVNEGAGKKPEQYLIEGFNANLQAKVASAGGNQKKPGGGDKKGGLADFSKDPKTTPVDAEHIIHLSLSEGMDGNWPFGNSVLEPLFKTFKQKSLLEDAMIIYRVQRAPERRVFYIDVGTMPTHKAMAFVERVKTEIHQKRIPNRTGGGDSVMDAAYNPMSIVEDYFFAQTCLNPKNSIPLLDGRTVTLGQVIEEYDQGKKNYVYSLNLRTHEMEPGLISWAGYTRRDAEQVRVHLDNDQYIDATPDHRFIRRDGSEVEAQDLKPDDSLMPLYLLPGRSGPKQKVEKYTRYISNRTAKKRFVHTTVCPKKPGRATVVHHIDFDSLNNNPDNLVEMTWEDHEALHKAAGTYSLGRQWQDAEAREKLIAGMRRLYDNRTDEFHEMLVKRNRSNGSMTWIKGDNAGSLKALKGNRAVIGARRVFDFSQVMFDRFIVIFNEQRKRLGCDPGIRLMSELLPKDTAFMAEYRRVNQDRLTGDKECERLIASFGEKNIYRLCRFAGYADFVDFKESYAVNHKVVRVERLTERADMCDITVEGPSNSHVFALAAGVYVHNSEGRGSKVETLPGGEALGQIDDLLYFDNKLKRGLGVPASYLPSGPEDGSQAYSDGRVGTAYIQEYRFAKYCQRLQSLLDPVFDQEFKEFLKKKGIMVSQNMYTLSFNEPQNFSKFRQVEIDTAHINTFGQLVSVPWMSRRFLASRYLGWTEDEILDNETQWKEENPGKLKSKIGKTAADEVGGGLRDVGIGGGPDPFAGDLGSLPPPEEGDQGPDAGGGDMSGGLAGPPPNPASTAPPMAGPGGAPPA